MNKNIFALAICFMFFTANANNSVDNPTAKTTSITIETDDEVKKIVATIVTQEQAIQLINSSSGDIEFIDGIIFSIDEVMYVVQSANNVSKAININVSVNVAGGSQATTTINTSDEESCCDKPCDNSCHDNSCDNKPCTDPNNTPPCPTSPCPTAPCVTPPCANGSNNQPNNNQPCADTNNNSPHA